MIDRLLNCTVTVDRDKEGICTATIIEHPHELVVSARNVSWFKAITLALAKLIP